MNKLALVVLASFFISFDVVESSLTDWASDQTPVMDGLNIRRILQQVESSSEACSLCPNGSPLSLPDKVPGYGLAGTCQEIAQAVEELYTEEDAECGAARGLLPSVCGCPAVEDACYFCDGQAVNDPDYMIQSIQRVGLPPMSCQDWGLLSTQFASTSNECYGIQLYSSVCGCPTIDKISVHTWLLRIGASLSLAGSLFIMIDVLRKYYQSGTMSIYHELMLTISIFDFISSTAWALGTLPIPVIDPKYGEPFPVIGAKGNYATCKAQGFFHQLGFTSIWYNLTLSLYYVLVIRYGWTERRVGKIRRWLHLPMLPGVALAFIGIPWSGYDVWGCSIPTYAPGLNSSRIPELCFITIPVCFVILVITVNMILVYLAVQKQTIAANRWAFRSTPDGSSGEQRNITPHSNQQGNSTSQTNDEASSSMSIFSRVRNSMSRSTGQNSRMERDVFWQCFFYLAAFYLTWPFLIVESNIAYLGLPEQFYFVVNFLNPAQGFWNALVYTRPRMLKAISKWNKSK